MLWLVGGLDNSGGAGLIRDLVSARALSPLVDVHAIATALTYQARLAAAQALPVDGSRFQAALTRAPQPSVIKLGLLPDSLGAVWREHRPSVPCIADPVIWASDGGALGASAVGIAAFAAGVCVLTPNFAETLALATAVGLDLNLERGPEGGEEKRRAELESRAKQLRARLGSLALLLKAVPCVAPHLVADLLVSPTRAQWLIRPRRLGASPRGTGCALASNMAARLSLQPPQVLHALTSICEAEDHESASAGGPQAIRALHVVVQDAVLWLDQARQHTHTGPDGRQHILGALRPAPRASFPEGA